MWMKIHPVEGIIFLSQVDLPHFQPTQNCMLFEGYKLNSR
eukprot:UN13349